MPPVGPTTPLRFPPAGRGPFREKFDLGGRKQGSTAAIFLMPPRSYPPWGDQLATLRAVAPTVADEIATRYASAKIAPAETTARLWSKTQKRLLADGGEADLRELAFDGKADGALSTSRSWSVLVSFRG
jgi:hypothetical protein